MGETLKALLVASGFIGGIVGLLLLVGRAIIQGSLVPRSTLVDQQDRYKEQLQREREISENYRIASENVAKAFDQQGELLEKVVEEQKFVRDFVIGLKRAMDIEARERRGLPGRQT